MRKKELKILSLNMLKVVLLHIIYKNEFYKKNKERNFSK